MNLDRLKELFEPDFENGLLYRKVRQSNNPAGTLAGSRNKQGYMRVGIDGRQEYTHRILWAMYHNEMPNDTLDHIDTDRSNNRIENLRIATQSQQCHNMNIPKHNTSGVKGVSFCKLTGKYRAELKFKRVRVFDKKFNTIEEAKEALILARKEFHGDFTNNGEKL